MAHDIVRLWSSYTKMKKTPQIYTRLKLSKNMQFGSCCYLYGQEVKYNFDNL